MMQGPTITWSYCQPTLHPLQLAGAGLVRWYKNALHGLMSHCSFRLINRRVRRSAPDHRAIARTSATSSSDASHQIAIVL
jgi:hypothetical protein